MRIITIISRLLVSLLFIFSGLIKANDPLGFSYKLVEYFEVFDVHFLVPIALPLAMFICAFEVILGFALLIGARINLTLWLLLLMIGFFTFLTFYSAYYEKVLSCGCFGDAIPLTPWQSFTKDVILLVLIILLFIGKQAIHSVFPTGIENSVLVLVIIASFAFPVYTYNYLPIIDFRPYAKGKNISEQMVGTPDEIKYFYTLKDKKTGEIIEVDKWPDNWDKKYDYVSSRTEVIKKGTEAKIKDFSITNLEGTDYTPEIVKNPGYTFLLVCYDLDKTNKDVFGKVNDFSLLCKQDSISFICLTASPKNSVEAFKNDVRTNIDFYNCDGTVLKTMVRANPGLMLIKGGNVIDIWHYNSFPAYSDLKEQHFKK
jgi:uncharacterized membrane protein YphA (DoxX/SURF4 family)